MKKLILIIMIALFSLYISAYVAFRAMGYYQWKLASISNKYRPTINTLS